MTILSPKLQLVQEQMYNKLCEIRETYKNTTDIGSHFEEILRSFLRIYLPQSYRIGQGEIIDSYGNQSKQIDVIVSNEYQPFFNTAFEPGLYLFEGVYCCGEVKGVLTTKEIERTFNNCDSFKSLKLNLPTSKSKIISNPSDAFRYFKHRAYFLFAFESQLSFETVFQKLRTKYIEANIPIEKQIDCVVILDKGIILNLGDGNGVLKAYSTSDQLVQGYAHFPKEYDNKILLNFLFWMQTTFVKADIAAPIIMPYLLKKDNELL